MTKRICFALPLALLIGITSSAHLQARAQNNAEKEQNPAPKTATEKSSKEQNATEKKPESTVMDTGVNFPQAQGAVELRPAVNARITLKLTDTSRAVYEAIGKQAKISVLFDPDYVPRSVSVDLESVSLQDALKIVAFQARTFWRPVTSSAIFVAADTQAKRREFEQQIVKSFYLPNISGPADLQDIVNELRTIVEIQRIQQTPSNNTIVVRATPEQMTLAERIIDELSKAKKTLAGGYRLDIKVYELVDEKKVSSRTYTLLLEPHEVGKLRTISHVANSEVGKNIDCQVRSETERTVELRLIVEILDLAAPEHGAAESAHTEPVRSDAIPQQFRMETSVTLELGKPTIVSNFGDPSSRRMFQIEVTVARAKDKE